MIPPTIYLLISHPGNQMIHCKHYSRRKCSSNIYSNEMHKIMDYPSVLVKSYNLATSTMCLERSETKRNETIIRFIIMASYFDIEKKTNYNTNTEYPWISQQV